MKRVVLASPELREGSARLGAPGLRLSDRTGGKKRDFSHLEWSNKWGTVEYTLTRNKSGLDFGVHFRKR